MMAIATAASIASTTSWYLLMLILTVKAMNLTTADFPSLTVLKSSMAVPTAYFTFTPTENSIKY